MASLSWESFSVDAQKGDGYFIHDLIKKTVPLVVCTLFNRAIFHVFPQRALPDMCAQPSPDHLAALLEISGFPVAEA